MVRYGTALAVLLLSASASSVYSFSNFEPSSTISTITSISRRTKKNNLLTTTTTTQRQVAARSSDFDNKSSVGDAVDALTSAARDSIHKAVVAADDDEPDLYEAEMALKKKLVLVQASQEQQQSKTYTVTLPLSKAVLAAAGGTASKTATSTSASSSASKPILSMGVTLRQINKGRVLLPEELVLDTLSIQTAARVDVKDVDMLNMNEEEDTIEFDLPTLMRKVKGDFSGTVVTQVSKKSAAWAAGVRAGDILKSTSATLGDALWPKSTLEGVRSAISSRRATSGSIQLEFQRVSQVVDNLFELTLTRPIGMELKGTDVLCCVLVCCVVVY